VIAVRLALWGSLIVASCAAPARDWDVVKREIRANYPSVQQISSQKLADWLSNTNRTLPLLLDVRTAEEFAVSHLQNARRIEPDANPKTALAGVPKATPIVTYCSVGFRSSAFAARLQGAGFTNVRQLDGSIFQWANEARPVYRGDQRAFEVHPYNDRWSKLLDAPLRAGATADVPH
jgi:rhodanese-related sulfurtransferase